MKKKNLVVFTGIDGSGKTTQAKLLVDKLKQEQKDVVYIRNKWEPFILRPLIRRWKRSQNKGLNDLSLKPDDIKEKKQVLLGNPFFRFLWLIAFFLDYGLQIFFKIRFRIHKPDILVSDRIFYDSVIDQAINLGERKNVLLDRLDSFWMKILFPVPDLVFYVDCPEDVAFKRKQDEYTPNIEYLVDRRKLYLSLSGKYKWIQIDGTLAVNDIAVNIHNIVRTRFKEQYG